MSNKIYLTWINKYSRVPRLHSHFDFEMGNHYSATGTTTTAIYLSHAQADRQAETSSASCSQTKTTAS